MDTRLLRAVRGLIEISRRKSDKVREPQRRTASNPRARQPRRKGLISIALSLAVQVYHRPYDEARGHPSVFVITRRSKKTAAAAASLSKLLGASLPCLAPGRRTFAPAAWLDASAARARHLHFRPIRFLKTLHSITRRLDAIAAPQVVLLVFSYWNYRILLPRWQPAFFLCVSDLSARRIAGGCAANASETPVLYFQDDWHHYTVPPFRIAAASVLNGTGLMAARPSLGADCIAVSRGTVPLAPQIRACPQPPKRFGVALNNYFDQDDVLGLVQRIAGRFPGAEIIVRRHPRSRTPLRAYPDGLVEAPAGQSIAAFAASCDIVLVGNSAVQIGLLLAGVAVIHVGNLDQLWFDAYGYVAAGIVYGISTFEDLAGC
jgi:hypothetical protein